VRRAFLFSLAGAFLAGAIAAGQVGGAPTTPAQSTAPPKSTALILGQVVDGSTGQPIAEAIVTLTQLGGRGRGGIPPGALPAGASPQAQQAMQAAAAAAAAAAGRGGPGGPQRVMTGSDGRFVFHGLLPGQYQLTTILTGYTSSLRATAGGAGGGMAAVLAAAMTSSSGTPTALALTEGEYATNVKLRLWKHAVVSGTVVDDAGEPAIGVRVQVAQRVMAAGRARYVPASSATTDDRGAYRVSGLVPGGYLVVVPQTQVSIGVSGALIDSMTWRPGWRRFGPARCDDLGHRSKRCEGRRRADWRLHGGVLGIGAADVARWPVAGVSNGVLSGRRGAGAGIGADAHVG
jgi:protocatechuate 3,4-dioxygenase beta subunit